MEPAGRNRPTKIFRHSDVDAASRSGTRLADRRGAGKTNRALPHPAGEGAGPNRRKTSDERSAGRVGGFLPRHVPVDPAGEFPPQINRPDEVLAQWVGPWPDTKRDR